MNNIYKDVKFGGTALAVLLAASIAAFGQGNGNNQAAGQAGATGTSNVVVTNSPAQPVPVKEQNNPAFQPFHFSAYLTVNGAFVRVNIPVPAGKRLVIEQVSGYLEVAQTSGTIPYFGLQATSAGTDALMFSPMTWVGPNDSGPLYVANQQAHMYADGGTNVVLSAYKSRDINNLYTGSATGYLSISGHLVNIP